MVSKRLSYVTVLALALALGVSAISMAAQLGDPAAELKLAEWVKGGPLSLAEGKGKNIYVVEFWATWCLPCRESIPHLTKLQKKLKDKGVIFIGVSSEDADTVKSYVKKMGSQMDYAVAVDYRQMTASAYRGAFGVGTIPHAFVVDREGRIAWHGNPMAGMEAVIEAILAGKYDIRAMRLYGKTVELIIRYRELAGEALNADQKKAQAKLGERILGLAAGTKNALFLSNFAWMIRREEGIEERDIELSLKAAKAAYDLSEEKGIAVLHVYAWALFETGEVAEAIEMESRALELSEDEDEKAVLKESLELFEQKAQESG